MWKPLHPIKENKKMCITCGISKSVLDFHKQKKCKEGIKPECKGCSNANRKIYYAKNKDRIKERMSVFNKTEHRRDYARKYQAERMRKLRESSASRPRPESCEVCSEKGNVVYDHCHKTGLFRGWLCGSCNTALGYARDNPAILHRLASYLSEFAMTKAYEEK